MTGRSSWGLWRDRIGRRIPLWLRPGRSRIGNAPAPVSRQFGLDRGLPIDRWYIERFLAANAEVIRGRVLECGDSAYTTRFGGARVERSDVLHPQPGNPAATLVGDLASGEGIPAAAFDALVLTQVLPFIFDVQAAVRGMHGSLKPGGTALITVPGISQISRFDMDRWGDYWRFTDRSLARLLEEAFPGGQVRVEAWGNPLAASAFLYGLAAEELGEAELLHRDQDYQVLLTAVVRKAGG